MTTAKVRIPFMPFDRQAGPLLSYAPTTVAVAGARGGKTQTGAAKTSLVAISQEDALLARTRDESGKEGVPISRTYADDEPFVIGVGAPTYPMLNRVILPTVLRYIPDELKIGRYHHTEKRLKVRGKYRETHIYFISARFWESWYGLKLSFAWVDEFALIKETMYDELGTRLSDAQGSLLLTGTPQGPNWAHDRLFAPWRDGEDRWGEGGNVDFYSWTTMANPYLDRAFIEAKRKTMPKRYFDRTFRATWDTFEGQIYEEFLRAAHVRRWEEYTFRFPNGSTVGSGPKAIYIQKVIAGVDWGYKNPGVILVFALDHTGRWFLLEESVAERVLVKAEPLEDSWILRARALRVRWGIANFYCDTENPEAIAQFRKAGLPASGAIKDVLPGIETVARYLHVDEETGEPRLIFLEGVDRTIDEVTYYHWDEKKEKPAKINDHCPDAARYALHTYERRGSFEREPDYAPA
ncbi:MAG: hypothetical protein JSW58_08120 [Candidatus Latescibacterota bacterium]|nr:MAG: hypothetical protein JSW58_08120 [Candidatus Latescibacterota bacterium]